MSGHKVNFIEIYLSVMMSLKDFPTIKIIACKYMLDCR